MVVHNKQQKAVIEIKFNDRFFYSLQNQSRHIFCSNLYSKYSQTKTYHTFSNTQIPLIKFIPIFE